MKRMTTDLEKTRAQIAALQTERESISRQLSSRAEAVQEVKRFVVDQGLQSRLDVTGFATPGHTPRSWPALVGAPGTIEPMAAANIAPVLAVLTPKAVVTRLVELMDEAVGDRYGLDRMERVRELSRIAGELLALERREEISVRQLQQDGVEVSRRPDIENPLLIVVVDPEAYGE